MDLHYIKKTGSSFALHYFFRPGRAFQTASHLKFSRY